MPNVQSEIIAYRASRIRSLGSIEPDGRLLTVRAVENGYADNIATVLRHPFKLIDKLGKVKHIVHILTSLRGECNTKRGRPQSITPRQQKRTSDARPYEIGEGRRI